MSRQGAEMVNNSIKRNATALALAAMIFAAAGGYAHAADMPVKAAPPAPAPAPSPPFFIVNQNTVSYSYQFTATNPGDPGTTPKNVVSFSHFDVWAYGTNFFNVDWLKATNGSVTPVENCTSGPGVNCPGYTEIYAFFRSTLGWNQLTNSKMFSFGPLTNIEFVGGVDANTDNTTLGSAKRSIQGGIQFDFATPYKGFLNASINAYHEWQHDGFAVLAGVPGGNPSGEVDFNTTWAVEALYNQPLCFLPASIPLTFQSLLIVHGPKGCGEACPPSNPMAQGLSRTTEYLTQQKLSLDVGQMLGGKSDMLSIWGAYRYWKNKFGINPNQPGFYFPATLENTWIAGVTLAF